MPGPGGQRGEGESDRLARTGGQRSGAIAGGESKITGVGAGQRDAGDVQWSVAGVSDRERLRGAGAIDDLAAEVEPDWAEAHSGSRRRRAGATEGDGGCAARRVAADREDSAPGSGRRG